MRRMYTLRKKEMRDQRLESKTEEAYQPGEPTEGVLLTHQRSPKCGPRHR